MKGRWAIRVAPDDTLRLLAWPECREVPVVPCDEAAIERVAQMLCHGGMEFADGWVRGDTDRDYPRLIAEAVLRAAAGEDAADVTWTDADPTSCERTDA